MQRRKNRQAQTGMQLDMFRDTRPSGANLTGKVFGREIDLLRQQQTKSFGLTFADAVARQGPCQTRAYCRR